MWKKPIAAKIQASAIGITAYGENSNMTLSIRGVAAPRQSVLKKGGGPALLGGETPARGSGGQRLTLRLAKHACRLSCVHLLVLDIKKGHIVHSESAQHRAQIGLVEIMGAHQPVGEIGAAGRDDEDGLVLQE